MSRMMLGCLAVLQAVLHTSLISTQVLEEQGLGKHFSRTLKTGSKKRRTKTVIRRHE